MKIVRYTDGAGVRVGVLAGAAVHPFPEEVGLNPLLALGLDAVLAAGAEVIARTDPVPVARVRLLAPVEPQLLRDFTTFEQHVEAMTMAIGDGRIPDDFYEFPPFYTGTPHAISGPEDDIPVPPGSTRFDLELELAAVIGRPGRDLNQASARDHIIGYTIFNDWSARDLLFREIKQVLGPAKGKDTSNTFGPYLVTADELEAHRNTDDRLALTMTASINGEVLGKDNLAHAAWSPESCVQLASRGTWLRAGDVLGLGTCGTGCLAEFWGRLGPDSRPPLRPGDVVALEVTGLGTLTNTVVSGVEPIALPAGHRTLQNLKLDVR